MTNRVKKSFQILSVWLSAFAVAATLIFLLLDIFTKGSPVISSEFITQFPRNGMTSGGIFPAVLGTMTLTVISAIISIPFGIGCAIYLSEYAQPSLVTNLIRASIRNLSGIPSIIYGLFGLAIFVQGINLGTSMLSAGLTLGLLSLPYIITTTEESIKQVPVSMKEATLALGATKFEMIKDVVIPQSIPGIMTGVVLTLSRAAGETAPILFTGVAYYINRVSTSINQEFMALPYHLYMLSTQHNSIESVRPLAYGTALVLVSLVFLMNILAIVIRIIFSKK